MPGGITRQFFLGLKVDRNHPAPLSYPKKYLSGTPPGIKADLNHFPFSAPGVIAPGLVTSGAPVV